MNKKKPIQIEKLPLECPKVASGFYMNLGVYQYIKDNNYHRENQHSACNDHGDLFYEICSFRIKTKYG